MSVTHRVELVTRCKHHLRWVGVTGDEIAQQRRDSCLTIGAAVCAGRGVYAVAVLVVGDAGGDAEPRQQFGSLLPGPHPRAVSRHPHPMTERLSAHRQHQNRLRPNLGASDTPGGSPLVLIT